MSYSLPTLRPTDRPTDPEPTVSYTPKTIQFQQDRFGSPGMLIVYTKRSPPGNTS